MRSFGIEVRWDGEVVSGLSLVGPLRDTVDVVTFRENAGSSRTVPGRSTTDVARFERDLGDDLALDLWARGPVLRKDVGLTFTDPSDGLSISYTLHSCWVCGYGVVPDPGTGAVVESLSLSVGRWERVIPPASLRAEHLAVQRSAEVRRVNIGALMSKYQDQTPSVLDRILAEATRKGDVLFLDEADALFAKRSTVQDSHDRFAPDRVDQVLQLLSAHAGPIVVAENSSADVASGAGEAVPPA
ncbi:AAA family ATPase [Tessaracoccus antarcticus]|nr:AAA family ATPase [Tessaracoccus antarcticus]